MPAMLPMIFRPAGLVAEQLPFLPMHRVIEPVDVALGSRAGSHAAHQAAPVSADVQLLPKCHCLPLRVCFISGSERLNHCGMK